MSLPRYLDPSTSPPAWVDLPVAPRFGMSKALEEKNVLLETFGGIIYPNRLFQRRVWTMTFRLTESQLAEFRTMHTAVDGATTLFYFEWNSDSIYGHKESGFFPVQLTTPASPKLYDYALTITGEPEAMTIS